MKIKNLIVNKKILSVLFSTTITIGLVGCDAKSLENHCDIKEYHLHRYKKSGLVRFLGCEYPEFYGYERTDEVWYPKEEDSYFHFLEMRNNLLKIEDNELYLRDVEKNNFDFVRHHYQLDERVFQPVYRGYKIDQNKIIPSDWVDSLFKICEEYPYFKEEELYKVRELEPNEHFK